MKRGPWSDHGKPPRKWWSGIVRLPALLVLAAHAAQAEPEAFFRRLTAADGLSHDTVSVVLVSRSGYVWFGTLEGLCRYDGQGFTTFRHDPNDRSTLSSSNIGKCRRVPCGGRMLLSRTSKKSLT